ncbi:alpha/beta fold hydrolase [Actinomadura rubrisoli]|uniref:Alpha/beta hydrolase n=1 Tax=Actinomadura rubrisoli TaxID=2530368 RepID=A0A4R5CHM7_9ACTN|nr:alpha/beta hydrolase [Actinomadura rubrisoli]TDD96834.1 alpha/beta hydrolase [Actinomadura rubrisoli]
MTEFVATAVLDIGYEVAGPIDGPAAVAVHGWPDDVHCWDEVVPLLVAEGYRVYRPHLRGFGATRFRAPDRPRSGQAGALGTDLRDFLDALDLEDVVVAGHDWGARAGYVAGALFPERVRCLVAMSAGHGASGPDAPLPYPLAHAYWYEWFVATGRGQATMRDDRRGFSRYLWESWSPGWRFSDAEFDQAARAWDNDDWPDITVSAYLHRWGEHPGDPAYADTEKRLADVPAVQVPTLVLHGAEDGDNLPSTSEGKDELFPRLYQRVELEGVGHFVPREAPARTAREILRWSADN